MDDYLDGLVASPIDTLITLRDNTWAAEESYQTSLFPLLPPIVSLALNSQQNYLLSVVCALFENLTLYESCRQKIVECGGIRVLIKAVMSRDRLPEGGTMCAVLALANLAPNSPELSSIFSLEASRRAIRDLVTCFTDSLTNKPYDGLRWEVHELALGTCNLSKCESSRKLLVQSGMVANVLSALRTQVPRLDHVMLTEDGTIDDNATAKSKDTVGLLLTTLWNLSDE